MTAAASKNSEGTIASNRNARRDYHVQDTIEAGIQLLGTEVKSIRAGKVNIADAFARIEKGQAILYQCDISPYDKGNIHNHDSRRARKLLLHKAEIIKLFSQISVKGRSLIALEMYWKNGHVKVLLGVGQGKTHGDKRQEIKTAAVKREIDRAIKNRLR